MAQSRELEILKRNISGLNLEKGIDYCAGSEEFYIELLEDFAQVEAIEDLKEKYAKEDKQYYVVAVHALKGLARTLGFEEFGNLAEKVQFAGQDDSLTDDMHKELIEQFSEIVTEIRKVMF